MMRMSGGEWLSTEVSMALVTDGDLQRIDKAGWAMPKASSVSCCKRESVAPMLSSIMDVEKQMVDIDVGHFQDTIQ